MQACSLRTHIQNDWRLVKEKKREGRDEFQKYLISNMILSLKRHQK